MIGRIVRGLFNKAGYQLTKKDATVEVLSKPTNTKRALVSILGYSNSNSKAHTIGSETKAICEALFELGYNVDVLDFYRTNVSIDFSKYSLVMGMRKHVEDSLRYRWLTGSEFPKVVAYTNGPHPYFQNEETMKRLIGTFKRTNTVFASSVHLLDDVHAMQYTFADLLILFGNDFVRSTYEPYKIGPIETVNAIVHTSVKEIDLGQKSFDNTKFLYFGSYGAVHRGLDLLLEYFERHPELSLTICGPLEKTEPFFASKYERQLKHLPNIALRSFIAIDSDEFVELMLGNTFVIYPSVTEGRSISVMTCMKNGGLIPIVTKNVGVDTNDFGINIEGFGLEQIHGAVQTALKLSRDELVTASYKAKESASAKTGYDDFATRIKELLLTYELN